MVRTPTGQKDGAAQTTWAPGSSMNEVWMLSCVLMALLVSRRKCSRVNVVIDVAFKVNPNGYGSQKDSVHVFLHFHFYIWIRQILPALAE